MMGNIRPPMVKMGGKSVALGGSGGYTSKFKNAAGYAPMGQSKQAAALKVGKIKKSK